MAKILSKKHVLNDLKAKFELDKDNKIVIKKGEPCRNKNGVIKNSNFFNIMFGGIPVYENCKQVFNNYSIFAITNLESNTLLRNKEHYFDIFNIIGFNRCPKHLLDNLYLLPKNFVPSIGIDYIPYIVNRKQKEVNKKPLYLKFVYGDISPKIFCEENTNFNICKGEEKYEPKDVYNSIADHFRQIINDNIHSIEFFIENGSE